MSRYMAILITKTSFIKIYKYSFRKKILSSQSSEYVKKFVQLEKKNQSKIIEIHNRPFTSIF